MAVPVAISDRPRSNRDVAQRANEIRRNRLDQFRVTCYPWRRPAIVLDEVLTQLSWSEDAEKASVEVTLTIDDAQDIARYWLAPGTWIEVEWFNRRKSRWSHVTPRCQVWSRALTDELRGTAQVSALDVTSFLQRAGTQDYFFRATKQHPKGWTASQIATAILRDLGVKARVVPTAERIPYLFMQSVTPYEAIVTAFTRERQLSGARYRIRAGQYDANVGGLINRDMVVIAPLSVQPHVWELVAGSNLLQADWFESLDGKKTEIIVTRVAKPKKPGAAGREVQRVQLRSPDANRYGRLRQFTMVPQKWGPSRTEKWARNYLKRSNLTRSASVSVEGIPELRASDAVWVDDPKGTGLRGLIFCSSVAHSVTSGTHTTDVGLIYVEQVPEITPTPDQLDPKQNPLATERTVGGADGGSVKGNLAVAAARTQLGVPYVYGGENPGSGMDCSGLTHYAWKQAGVEIGRTTVAQQNVGTTVSSISEAAPGDLIFTRLGAGKDGHVGMYTGEGSWIAAPHTGAVVTEGAFNRQALLIKRPVPLEAGGGSGKATTKPVLDFSALGEEVGFAPGEIALIGQRAPKKGSNPTTGLGGTLPSAPASTAPTPTGGGTVPTSQVSKLEAATWMMRSAQQAGIPPELPVMVSLLQSGLVNAAPYNGPDGKPIVGYFGIRPERFNMTPQQAVNPETQMLWFLARARLMNAGNTFGARGTAAYGEWCSAITEWPRSSSYQGKYPEAVRYWEAMEK